jgi:hypothetical protein
MDDIDADTGIIPEAIAAAVVDDVQRLLPGDNIKNYRMAEKYLVGHAEAVYAANKDFRKKVQSEADDGNAGRDYLFTYMRHWLAAWLKKHDSKVFRKLPHGYGSGR